MFDYLDDHNYKSSVCKAFSYIDIEDLNVFKEKVYDHLGEKNFYTKLF